MRITDKLALIDKVGRELQSRFTFREIDAFLAALGVSPPTGNIPNSKWIYAKTALQGESDQTVIRASQELDIISAASGDVVPAPRIWQDTGQFRLFISHVSQHKARATRIKTCLSPFGIDGFVAHEDIQPTLEWQIEIERGLHNMDALLAIHTSGFAESIWCQQEIGFALGRSAKIISLSFEELPVGFISKQQALKRGRRSAEEIASEIDAILAEEPRTKERLASAKATLAPSPSSFDDLLDEDVPF